MVRTFPLKMSCQKKSAMRCRMRNMNILKVRRYVDCMIDLNKYLAVFPGAKESENR